MAKKDLSGTDDAGPVSRRDFFRTVGAGTLATSVMTAVETEAQATAPRAFGPGEVPIRLTINGRAHALHVEPRTTLLDAVRTKLDYTGTKRVCDRGSCGACTMIVDGRAIYACSTLAIDSQNRNVRTIEGLAQGTGLHPVQQAFCETDGLMCGFCTPGFIVAAVALLETIPNPTPGQARRHLDGNICRCGTYVGVLEAAIGRPVVSRPDRPVLAEGSADADRTKGVARG